MEVFDLQQDTLFQAVHNFDRFLAAACMDPGLKSRLFESKKFYQLIGITCLLIAAYALVLCMLNCVQ